MRLNKEDLKNRIISSLISLPQFQINGFGLESSATLNFPLEMNQELVLTGEYLVMPYERNAVFFEIRPPKNFAYPGYRYYVILDPNIFKVTGRQQPIVTALST